jgi:predicted phage tail protein
MIQVKLMGEMGEKFGTDWVSADNNMRDILKLIEAQTEGFADYIRDLVEKDNVGIEIVHGKDLLIETEDDIADMFLPVINDTVYITPVPTGAGVGDIFKVIVGVILIIFAPQIIGLISGLAGGMSWSVMLAQEATKYVIMTYALAAVGGLLALKGLTDYLTPQTPGESPDSYLFGNAQENVKMGSPVPLLYGELIVPGVTINYSMRDQKTTGYNASFTYINSTSNSPANSGGDSTKSSAVVMQK